MRRTSALMLAALAATVWADEPGAIGGDAADAVRQADRRLTEARLKGDAGAFDRLTTDDYMATGSSGRQWDKQQSVKALRGGQLTFEKIDESDVKIRPYGDAAVVTGLAAVKGKAKDREFDQQFRWTRVFVRQNGEWKCAAEQLSRVWTPEEGDKEKDK